MGSFKFMSANMCTLWYHWKLIFVDIWVEVQQIYVNQYPNTLNIDSIVITKKLDYLNVNVFYILLILWNHFHLWTYFLGFNWSAELSILTVMNTRRCIHRHVGVHDNNGFCQMDLLTKPQNWMPSIINDDTAHLLG